MWIDLELFERGANLNFLIERAVFIIAINVKQNSFSKVFFTIEFSCGLCANRSYFTHFQVLIGDFHSVIYSKLSLINPQFHISLTVSNNARRCGGVQPTNSVWLVTPSLYGFCQLQKHACIVMFICVINAPTCEQLGDGALWLHCVAVAWESIIDNCNFASFGKREKQFITFVCSLTVTIDRHIPRIFTREFSPQVVLSSH